MQKVKSSNVLMKLILGLGAILVVLAIVVAGVSLDGYLLHLASPVPMSFEYGVRLTVCVMLLTFIVKGIWTIGQKNS